VRANVTIFALLASLAFVCSPAAESNGKVRSFWELPASLREQISVGHARSSRDIAASPFGTHTTVFAEGGSAPFYGAAVAAMSEAGYKWVADYVRIFSCDGKRPEEVTKEWDPLPERYLDYARQLRDAKIELLVRLDPIQRKNGRFSVTLSAEQLDCAAAFTRAVVRQLKPYVRHWQILNEPNAGNEKPEVTPEQYVRIAQRVSTAIRQEQAEAVVYGPATAMLQCLDKNPYPWIDGALGAGLLKYIDVFSFHPYRQATDLPEQPSEFSRWRRWENYQAQIRELRERLKSHHDGKEVPVASTEDGAADFVDDGGEQKLAWVASAKNELRRGLLDFWLGVRPRIHFCFYRNIDNAFYDFEGSFNIITKDFQKKPIYYAAQNLHAVIDDSYVRDTSVEVKVSASERGKSSGAGRIHVQTYTKARDGFDELLVFYWSANRAENTHLRVPARMTLSDQGWEAPLLIDLMTMPSRRPAEVPDVADRRAVGRRGSVALTAYTSRSQTVLDRLEVRDYPLLIKWIRPRRKP
jgi:hypothetical protein